MAAPLSFFMSELVTFILRGISGVGKTFIRKALVKACEAMNKDCKVISKDDYRRYLDKAGGYHYTPKEESGVTNWYTNQMHAMTYKGYFHDYKPDLLILDNTHVRSSELMIPFIHSQRISKYVLINVGNAMSKTYSEIGDDIIQRQRDQMLESDKLVMELARSGAVQVINIPERFAKQEMIDDIVKEYVK